MIVRNSSIVRRLRPKSMVAVVCILATIGAAAGVGASDPPDRIDVAMSMPDEPFPGYGAMCGFPIVVAPTPHVSQAAFNADHDPIIVLDPRLDAAEEAFHRVFMIAHECAHHRMGHASPEGRARRLASRREVRDQELSADCWAAETLSRGGLAQFSTIMAKRFRRAGLYSPGGGYPAGTQRSAIVRQCAAVGRRDRLAHGGAALPPADVAAMPHAALD